jgi:TonB family protein
MQYIVKILVLLSISTTSLAQESIQTYTPALNYGEKPELKRLVEQELFIPEKYLAEKINNEIILCFVVTENSEIRELQVSKSINSEIDKIALELFDKILWNAAIYNGRPINTKECITLKFNYKKYAKFVKKRGYDKPEYIYTPYDSTNTIYKLIQLDDAPQPIFEDKFIEIGDFIKKEIRYPELAYSNSITGKVQISFVIEQSGRVSNIKVCNNLGGGCDAEALRLLKLLSWKPGFKNGEAVRTKLLFTLNFNLIEGADINYVPSNSLGGVY